MREIVRVQPPCFYPFLFTEDGVMVRYDRVRYESQNPLPALDKYQLFCGHACKWIRGRSCCFLWIYFHRQFRERHHINRSYAGGPVYDSPAIPNKFF